MNIQALKSVITDKPFLKSTGRVLAINGPIISASIPYAKLGDLCKVETANSRSILAQVIAFNGDTIQLTPFDNVTGVAPNAEIENTGGLPVCHFSLELIGSVCNAFGNPIDKFQEKQKPKMLDGGQGRQVLVTSAAPGAVSYLPFGRRQRVGWLGVRNQPAPSPATR